VVDKYGTGQDPGCYPGTNVLINRLDIRDEQILEDAERDITLLRAAEFEFLQPPYSFNHLCNIHKTLFGDLYPWAGCIRQVDISKGSTRFCNVAYIDTEIDKLFAGFTISSFFQGLNREDLITAVAEFYGNLNMIHPFREGNGRAQRLFFEHVITNAGCNIFWKPIEKEEWVEANIAAVTCDYSALEFIFDRCIREPLNDD
jgi:cell filamentation protein, protein adenylyltransferase